MSAPMPSNPTAGATSPPGSPSPRAASTAAAASATRHSTAHSPVASRGLREGSPAFPFETDHDRANYIGALLTPALLRLLPPPWPMLCLNAHQPGSGKTLLGSCIRVLHGGTHRASLPWDDEEIRKQITTDRG